MTCLHRADRCKLIEVRIHHQGQDIEKNVTLFACPDTVFDMPT